MRYRSSHSRRAAGIDFNATPMIDVIFMLTVFFMLVSRFSSAENIPMQLPRPLKSAAREEPPAERVVLNCRPAIDDDPSAGVLYSLGPNPPEPLSNIARRLADLKAQRKAAGAELRVVLRADRRLRFADVRPAMQTVAALDIPLLNVAAVAGEGRP